MRQGDRNLKVLITGKAFLPDGSERGPVSILIRNGKIVDILERYTPPSDVEVLDFGRFCAFPGFFDAHTHIGNASERALGTHDEDVNESTDPVTPHVRACDGIDAGDPAFRRALSGGVTRLLIAPGSANVFGGFIAFAKTCGEKLSDLVENGEVAIKAAFGENPKRVYGTKDKWPKTRMAVAATFREWLIKAKRYAEGKDKKEFDFKLEALSKVFTEGIPLHVHCHRADDIETAARICAEIGAKAVFIHTTEGYKVAEVLAENGFSAVVGPLLCGAGKLETKERSLKVAKALVDAGVKIAITTDHPVLSIDTLRFSAAAISHMGGLSRKCALLAITKWPAEIAGINDLGVLQKGARADITIWTGDPLSTKSRVMAAFVDGRLAYEVGENET